jgi:hypothetical protein|tara:strand:+ start:212 stop:412 length:201 start_codon:yes stop_codon:yes gene_type:complete
MMVRLNGAPAKSPPAAVNRAEIQGQGSISYAKTVVEATPNTAMGKMTTGQKAGMGAALRGGSYKSC